MKNLPNILTAFRILLLPFFVYFYVFAQKPIPASVIFLLAGLTDVADGFIARKYGLITKLGALLDPLADKLLHLTVTTCIAIGGVGEHPKIEGFRFMWVIVGCLMCKELVMLIGAILLYNKNDIVVPARWYGKLSSLFLSSVILAIILLGDIMSANLKIALAFTALLACILACIGYSLNFLKIRRKS
ncbi:MAG: CDP-alcohol phosphatidyltransferase family protein [Clostridiales bacterium]|jgi:cardiolipin synthase|nr:CDP-alcohol phosphatidyltransferase family protein [Clostridiales bacterium]